MTDQEDPPLSKTQPTSNGFGSAFNRLYVKHRLATSPVAGPISKLRDLWGKRNLVQHPELGLLFQEDQMMAALLEQMIQPNWDCLDIGAHLGSVSYKFAEFAPNGRHAMIEASPEKAALLTKSFPNADVFATAVCDTDGEVTFYENLDAPGFSSLANRKSRGRVQEITVPAHRVDTLIGNDRNFDLIKIDVEGFEYPALKGADNLLKRCQPAILFEAGAVTDLDVDTSSYDDLFSYLTNGLGYQIFAAFDLFHDRPPISAEAFNMYRTYPFLAFNYFALHPDQAHSPHRRET